MSPIEDNKPAGRKKPAGRRKPKTVRIIEIPQKGASRPRWKWAAAGVAVLILVIVVWFLIPTRKDTSPPASDAAGNAGIPGIKSPAVPAATPDAGAAVTQLAYVKAVRLQPSEPTRMDSLKAEVTAADGGPERLVYVYVWKVNDRIVEGAKGDTLNLSPFKIRDHVTVAVTPYNGDTAGFAVSSPAVAIHGIAPSLDLEIKGPTSKIAEPVEMQLVSVAPDSERVIFSLVPPHVPGMTIDKPSGKISWVRQPDQTGAFRFGAAVEDDNGTKVIKIFDITVK